MNERDEPEFMYQEKAEIRLLFLCYYSYKIGVHGCVHAFVRIFLLETASSGFPGRCQILPVLMREKRDLLLQ